MTHVRKNERAALLELAALPDDDWQPEHWATYDAVRAQCRDLFRRLAAEAEREAATPPQKPQSRPKPKQDPPELVAAKKAVRRRSRGICEVGSEVCTGEAQHFHHRKMRSAGGSHSERNGLDSCWACHDFIHANPETSYEHGWLLHSWENEGRGVTG